MTADVRFSIDSALTERRYKTKTVASAANLVTAWPVALSKRSVVRSQTGESGFYGFARRVLGLWFGLIFRRVRVLRDEAAIGNGPVLFVVNHPAGFADALLLISALRRQVHCLLERELVQGPFERLAASLLGMILYDAGEEQWPAALEAACRVFGDGGAVLMFVRSRETAATDGAAREAAEVALEAEAYLGREAPLPILPVHLFLPVPPSEAGEVLVEIDSPLGAQGAPWSREPELRQGAKLLSEAIQQACLESPFRLQPEVVDRFLSDLESVMREDFADRWSHRAHWKQKVEDFDLSPFLVRLTHQLNYSQPGRLAALNEVLRGYEESKRRAALNRFIGETAGSWRKSGWRRALVWIETIAGFPAACYGLLNLLVAWFVVAVAGAWKGRLWNATPKAWLARVLIAIACYAVQIALAAHFLGRSAAGFYAPSLPISGAYLIRYVWLVEHRTRALSGARGSPRTAERLRRRRATLIGELKLDQDRYAAALKIAH